MIPNPQTAEIEAAVVVWLATITPEERAKALAALYERLRWRMERGPS